MDMPLVLADVVGTIVGIIIVLITIASAISNVAKEKNKPQPGKMKEKAALQKELEKFLQDAINPQQKKKAKPEELELFEDDLFEDEAPVQPPPQRPRRQQQKSRQAQQRARSQQSNQSSQPMKPKEVKPQVSLSERAEIEAKERQQRLGGAVRERIQEKHEKHVQTNIKSDIGGNVGQQISRKFGSRKEIKKTNRSKLGEAREIRNLIKEPKSIRRAIILSEVLSPPKSLRRP